MSVVKTRSRGVRPVRQRGPVPGIPVAARPRPGSPARRPAVLGAVRDTDTFSSAQGLTFHPDEIAALGLAPTIVMLDPPVHTQLRALISAGFTPAPRPRPGAADPTLCPIADR